MTTLPASDVTPADEYARRRRARSRKFAAKVLMVLAPAHFYVGWSLLPDLPVDVSFQILGGVILAVSTVLIPFGTLSLHFFNTQTLVDRLVWAGALTMGWFSSLLMLALARDIALIIPGLRTWNGESASLVLLLSVLVTTMGFVNARRTARVVRKTITLEDLPPALHGFTIAQISDLHVGPTIKANYVRGVVERVNALEADLIAITGDMVDGRIAWLSREVAPLGDLRARHGAFAVTGNHEYYSGAGEWMEEFRRLGLRPLMNEHVVIHHDGAGLVLAGINDYSAARFNPALASDPEAALFGAPVQGPKILLAHQPRSAMAAVKTGVDLQLSGHTHGGQFWPWNHFVRLQQPFTAGLHRVGRMQVYISRGTGYWGPPKRFGAPSEITLITLSGAG